ncbi:hypothetical protein EB796_023394 [Bugula neritina]|uniref:Uncharacterized protein n=1 Tax=Bugula neritina TaxID=10212 RepID=A0A7J7IYM1_BUGNE|nr:hypothetical protein EB796_023394 [Bugula neritina]
MFYLHSLSNIISENNEDDVPPSEAATHFPGEPLVTEYLKLYSSVLAFKDGLAKILLDKDMMSSSQVLSELESKHVDISRPIIPQIEELNQSCAQLLDDCGLVVSDALTAAFREDYNVSSVVSGVTSYVGGVRSRSGSYGMAPAPPTTSPSNKRKLSPGIKNTTPLSVARHTPADTASFSELQQTLRKLQEDFDVEVQNHQDDVNHNTAMVMELQDTVAELRRELAIVKEQAETRESAEQASDQESSIMFTRLDAERNAKNLKRAVNNNKLTEEQYNEAVDKMDEYVSLPARRLSELVRKFVHHKNMMRIEDIIKNREDLEETDVVMLEKMENLQNKRTQRWMNKMDALAEKRAELANELMLSLEDLEQESGIFMIKPMFSYRGAIFSNAKPFRSQKVKEGPATRMGVPVPSQPEEASSARSNPPAATDARWATLPRRAAGTWNLASSMPSADDADISTVNIPRILELDVNRMMYGQNQVSVKSTPLLSNDRLVNAANSSTRSYVTVNRPAASYTRPASSGVPVTSKSTGNLPDGALKRSESAEMSGRLHSMPPLPPIARTNTLAAPDTAERLDTGRDSSVNASRLAREFTDDSIHLLPTHVTRVITKSISSHSLVQE